MCTSFVRKGRELVVGFNFDADPAVWDYRLVKNGSLFYIGIKVGATTYKIHGVNRNGNVGNLPYMNAPGVGVYRRGRDCQRLDLLDGDYIAGKRSYEELLQTVQEKRIVNVPNASMHAQFSDAQGHILIVEPGLGWREAEGDYSIITNFPVLEQPSDLSFVGYGYDRYRTGLQILEQSDDGFSAEDGLALLHAVRQEGPWATRISFVYAASENAVYYFLNGDAAHVMRHRFADA